MAAGTAVPYVFSVDLEDVRHAAADGDRHEPRVPHTTQLYLDFLARHEAVGTFFVVGEVARAHPELIARIAAAGHEIGCHSDRHLSLNRQDALQMREDLCRNLDALRAAGAEAITGYRAPCFSITAETQWAYGVLSELGFSYSSSILPARNPISGWAQFGSAPRIVDGVLELPITLLPSRFLPVPMGGGVYFRVLPEWMLRRAFRQRHRQGDAVLGYLHPYDIDLEQDFPHPGFSRWGLYQWLLRANRKAVFGRLEAVTRSGFTITSYAEHARSVRSLLNAGGEGHE